jgi:hypothetical protein
MVDCGWVERTWAAWKDTCCAEHILYPLPSRRSWTQSKQPATKEDYKLPVSSKGDPSVKYGGVRDCQFRRAAFVIRDVGGKIPVSSEGYPSIDYGGVRDCQFEGLPS